MDAERLSEIATFVEVVDANGFSAATARLGLSKSAVSKKIARLEERLGSRLLNRTTRRLSLTEAGEAFYSRAAAVVQAAQEAEQAAMDLAANPRGRLRVNAPMSFATAHLAPLIPRFAAAYPDIELEIDLNDRLVDLVEEGYDLAIRIGRLPDSSLVARRLAPSTHVICAAPAFLDAHGLPGKPEDLAGLPGLHYTLNRGTRLTFTGGRSVSLATRLRSNNGDLLREAAIGGMGILVSPTFIVWQALGEGRLVELLPGELQQGSAVHAVWPHRRLTPLKVRAFVDFLAERFGDPPYWEAGRRDAALGGGGKRL